MKRVALELERDSKRQKRKPAGVDPTAIFKDEMQEKTSTDLLNWTPGDSGYLSGKVVMRYPPIPQKYHIKMEIFSVGGPKQVDVTFLGPCADELQRQGLQFEINQKLRLSLKGAVTETKPAQGTILPVALKYSEGVALELQPIIIPGCTIDTWFPSSTAAEPSEPAPADDDFFVTFRDTRAPRQVVASLVSMDVDEDEDEDEDFPPMAFFPSPPKKPVPIPSIASKKYAEQNTLHCHGNPLHDIRNSSHPTPPTTPTSFPSSSRSRRTIPSCPQPLPNIRKHEPNLPPAPPAVDHPRPQVPYGFTPLSELIASANRYNMYSVIGVVTHITEASKTLTDDWSCSLRIVDPFNCDESLNVTRDGKEGLLVNCFTKQHKEWLPIAKEGSVVILRDIKTTTHRDVVVANGYHDRLRWAVYDPTTRQIGHGDLGGAPECEGLDEGYGVLFTPLYPAKDADLPYCVALDDWWRGVSEKRLAAIGTVHQVGDDSASISLGGASRRKHQLVSETKIDQYFDCTVQVIHGHPNGRTHRLYVTDGTRLDGGHPCRLDSCPPSLADYLLPIEMWDKAGLVGPKMLAGEYYLLKNVRIKRNRTGYAEGKLVEPKIRKLEHDDVDGFPNFKALLQRLKLHTT
ncbi:hypothetical protein B0H19DRAFT_1384521 [Mycena capillaripes]|nr:hypothetical protein B0H19DRAFT_1384521 [Mycena capillaripes]